MEALSYILSIGGLVSTVISLLIKGKNMKSILFFVGLGNALVGFSYLCTGNLNGSYSCFIGAVQSVINYFYDAKQKPIPVWLVAVYAASFIVVNLMVFSSLWDIFAIAASLISVMIVCQKNGKNFRRWALANNIIWCIYDILRGNYGPLVTHVVLFVFTAVGMITHDMKKNKE